MNSEAEDCNGERALNKGKARALSSDPTEHTPLLASGPGSLISTEAPTPHRLRSKLTSVFLLSLSFCILITLLLLLVAYSYGSRVAGVSPDDVLQHALVARGPDRVDVLNITVDGGIWIRAYGRVGLDAGGLMGVTPGEDDGLLTDWWKSVGRWGIQTLDRVSVNLTTTHIYSGDDLLATVVIPPLELPLTANPPPDMTWLHNVSVPLHILPTKNIPVIVRFVRNSWRDGFMNVRAEVGEALVKGGGISESGWRSKLSTIRSNVQTLIHYKIPQLPGLPAPGQKGPLPVFAQLVALQSFLITSNDNHLGIRANATAINPIASSLRATIPALPFMVSLPHANSSAALPIASIYTEPFALTYPNITFLINGTVLPISHNDSGTLSAFLSDYVSGIDSNIQISTPFFPDLSVNAVFPAPRPKPEILQNVTITDMRIKPLGATMAASGTVFARVVLPKGIKVGLDVNRVLPDVLVFDGEVPSDSAFVSIDVATNLPDPLPERAFAHIRPDDWLDALSVPVGGEDDEGSVVAVSAKIEDVPLEVLPGREREFSNFVGKVIFGSKGALAGVQGVAAVAVRVHGLPFDNGSGGEMELTDLPFQGSVWIGKKAI